MTEQEIIYNIAFVARSDSSLIDESLKFKDRSDTVLGENSFAHITLMQFKANSREQAKELYYKVRQQIARFELINIKKKFVNDKCWIEMEPREKHYILDKHIRVLIEARQMKIYPFNPSYDEYKPHLTIACLPNKTFKDKLSNWPIRNKHNQRFWSSFELVLGTSGPNWQFEEVIAF